MKSHKKLMIAFAVLIALGVAGTAAAITYYVHTAITPVSVTSHSNGDIVFSGHSYNVTCETSTDTDKYYNSGNCTWYYPDDAVTHAWTGDGSFYPTIGTSVGWWTAPEAEGSATIRVTVSDEYADPADSHLADDADVYDEITLTVQNHIYVDEDAEGNDDGTTWTNAFDDLQEALDIAVWDNEIWVAEGTYIPTSERESGVERSATFMFVDGVMIYGGFDPTTGDDLWSERDPAGNVVILSGDIDTDSAAFDSDDAWHVVTAETEDVTTNGGIDGCTITHGYATGTNPDDCGGGVYSQQEAPKVTNCKITGNFAGASGGGMYSNISSGQTIEGCEFTDNSADAGGGLYVEDSLYHVIKNCWFKCNEATVTHGGGLYVEAADRQRIANCSFVDNEAYDYGGGLFMQYQTEDPKITNSSFTWNTADKGGAIGIDQVAAANHGDLTITNTVFWGDTGTTAYGEIYEYGADDSYTTVNYSNVDGGWTGSKVYSEESGDHDLKSGANNIVDYPEFIYSNYDTSDTTTDSGGTNYIVVDDGTDYTVGDIIEYNHDHVGRIVLKVVGDLVYFYPTKGASTVSGKNIYQWDEPDTPSSTTITQGYSSYFGKTNASAHFTVGDIIIINDDGVGREVTNVISNYSVFFSPSRSTSTGWPVNNYGQYPELELDTDCDIASNSPCIDQGDLSKVHRHDVSDVTGTNARKIDDPSTSPSGQDYVDMGAYEYGTATPPSPTTITIVHLCFIDESSEYQGDSDQYDEDLQGYVSLMYNSGIADTFESGCLAIVDGIAGLIPSGYSASEHVTMIDVDSLPFAEGELYNGVSDYFDTIRDGETPDYVILSVDSSGSMEDHDLEGGNYGIDDFETWLETEYPGATIDVQEFDTEFWLAEMSNALMGY